MCPFYVTLHLRVSLLRTHKGRIKYTLNLRVCEMSTLQVQTVFMLLTKVSSSSSTYLEREKEREMKIKGTSKNTQIMRATFSVSRRVAFQNL